ncbi:class I SAM-dependent methyltransferase [Thalassotalea eurytherma]|uniref:Methyltransferase domain-containing protein n=1 Tax=Thalassotalea eurytherma TaxID=1144278 RepID=A0ABQ6H0Y6_9GAMM|nr:class I SAM-dependent methyltransferase [Thalassotalea eurytherma]GLX80735.1 hypothetical protein theurythT_01870 [Thalassotalea eurytherma]
MNDNLTFYSENTDSLVSQYDSVSFDSVHNEWLTYVPTNGMVLDIGAGSGRDARYLSEHGLKVYAVEPALALMQAAQNNSSECDITWYQDSLPNLERVRVLDVQFDLILLSAVWMHLSLDERTLSMKTMASLLRTGARLVITLRHGEFSDGRTTFPLSADEVAQLGEQNGLSLLLKTKLSDDQLGRGDVVWQTVVLGK